jgi:hypothetical protein
MYQKDGIRANAIAPGAVATEIGDSMGIPNDNGFDSPQQILSVNMQPLSDRKPYRPVDHKTGQEVPVAIPITDIIKGEIVKIPLVSRDRLLGSLTIVNSPQVSHACNRIVGCKLLAMLYTGCTGVGRKARTLRRREKSPAISFSIEGLNERTLRLCR